jgi:ElaB/YqjD/DUF883 family membrane-anchored ribosome-binding protein
MIGNKSSGKVTSAKEKWREAIDDTKKRLEEHKLQGQKLRTALRAFEENLLTDEPWPGEHAGTESPAVPA